LHPTCAPTALGNWLGFVMAGKSTSADRRFSSAEGVAADVKALVGQDDGKLMLVNIAKGECVTLFEGHTDWILALDTDWSSMRAVSCGGDGAVFLWDLADGFGQNLASESATRSCVRAVAVDWNPEQSDAFSSLLKETTTKSRKGRHTSTQNTNMNANGRKNLAGSNRSLPAPKSALVASLRGSAALTEGRPRAGRQALTMMMPKLTPLRALTGSDDGLLSLWDINSRCLDKTFNFHLRLISALAVDWKKFRALVGHGDSGLELIDLEASTTLRSLQGHSCLIGSICVSWPKAVALCGSGDGTLAVWDLRQGKMARTLKGHAGGITAATLHCPTMRALTGAMDHTVRLWSLKQGICLQVFAGHAHPVRSLSPDWPTGLVISTDVGGLILLCDLKDSTVRPKEVTLNPLNDPVCAGVISLQTQHEVGELLKDSDDE